MLGMRSGTPASVKGGKVAVLCGCCSSACTSSFRGEVAGDVGLKQSMPNFSHAQCSRGRKPMQTAMVAVNAEATSTRKCWC